jgi:hypothetical protein
VFVVDSGELHHRYGAGETSCDGEVDPTSADEDDAA